jgi:DNA-binding transcriptional regulator YdaS (Cro superfamily)
MLFANWLDTQGLSRKAAADLIGTTPVSVYYWAVGRHRPGPTYTKIIERITAGEVTAVDLQRGYELARSGDL